MGLFFNPGAQSGTKPPQYRVLFFIRMRRATKWSPPDFERLWAGGTSGQGPFCRYLASAHADKKQDPYGGPGRGPLAEPQGHPETYEHARGEAMVAQCCEFCTKVWSCPVRGRYRWFIIITEIVVCVNADRIKCHLWEYPYRGPHSAERKHFGARCPVATGPLTFQKRIIFRGK